MSASRPASRNASRANSIHEAPISLPVDPRVARPAGMERQGSHTHLGGLIHHAPNHQDPKLFGPGFSTAAPHSAVEAQVRYVLVTPEMLQAIESGHAPHTNLVTPAGTNLRAPTPAHGQSTDYKAPLVPTLSKHDGPLSESTSDKAEHAHEESALALAPLDEELDFPNPWARIRHICKEPFGEAIGTCVLIIFGNGVNVQVVCSKLAQGDYQSISWGWGVGVMFGVYIAGGISGAHINPAVTIALATFRGFPWRKVPGYALGQVIGAFIGSVLIQANYNHLISSYEGGGGIRTFGEATSTGALFFTQAQAYMSNAGAFFSEFLATGVLLAVILCLGDSNNNPAPAGMNGLILAFLIYGLGAALGTQTAYCLNPARDFGPRIAAAAFGYPHTIWTYRSYYFIWCCWLAPICGALAGCFVYDLFLFQGPESPLNRKWGGNWLGLGKRKQQQQQIQA